MTNPQSTTEIASQNIIPETIIKELKQQYQENLRLIEEQYQTLLADRDKKLEIIEEQYEALIKQYQSSLTDKDEQFVHLEEQYQQLLAIKDGRLEDKQQQIEDLKKQNHQFRQSFYTLLSKLYAKTDNNNH